MILLEIIFPAKYSSLMKKENIWQNPGQEAPHSWQTTSLVNCPALGQDCPEEWLQWAGRCKCWWCGGEIEAGPELPWTWSCLEQEAGGHWEGEGGWAEEVRTSGEKVRSGGDWRDLKGQ